MPKRITADGVKKIIVKELKKRDKSIYKRLDKLRNKINKLERRVDAQTTKFNIKNIK